MHKKSGGSAIQASLIAFVLHFLCNIITEARCIPNNPDAIPNYHLTINNQSTMKNTNKETLKTVLQFIVSVITALLATLGVQSCVSL